MKKLATLVLSLFLTTGIALADTPKDKDKDADAKPAKAADPAKPKPAGKAEKADSALAAEIEELRQAIQSQQEQLQQLKEELAKRDRQIDEAREAAAAANARAAEASTKAAEAVSTTAEVKSTATALNSTVSDLKASTEVLKTTVANDEAKADQAGEEHPTTIHYKGVELTPGGFVAAETVFRTHATGDDINTQLTGLPFPGGALGKVSENSFTGRQSRLSLRADTTIANVKATAYVETDFLGTGVTSNNRQSNSYVLRYRQFWARAAFDSGLSVSGGQMWSLVTEDKKGIENLTELQPLVIDPQYVVGYAWQRAYGFRVAQTIDKFTFAAGIESPQTTVGGRGFANNFFVNSAGQGGGLTNFVDTTGYTANKSPDFLVKAAYDGWGHYEVVGILSPFRDRVYPCGAIGPLPAGCATAGSVVGAFNDGRVGGGVGATARLPVLGKKGDFVAHFQGGDGIGRYSSAQLSDVTVRPTGTLAPIRSAAWLGEIELHPIPKFDFYAYYGGEYAARTDFLAVNAAGANVAVGYGSPLFNNSGCSTETPPTGSSSNVSPTTPGAVANCAGDVRVVWEGTLGFWHNIYSGPKGRFRWGVQYSYLTKIGWSATGGLPAGSAGVAPKAVNNMAFTSFRYYLP